MGFLDAVGGAFTSAENTVSDAAYQGACGVGNAVSGAVTSVENGITGGVHKAEDWVDEGSHSLAAKVADVPVLGTAAKMGADAATFGTQVVGGVVGGATSFAGGLVNAAAHPLNTLGGLEAIAEHLPGGQILTAAHQGLNVLEGKESVKDAYNNTFDAQTTMHNDAEFWGKMKDGIVDPYKQEASEGRYGEMVGRGIFDVGSLLAGAGEAEAGTKVAEVAGDAGKVGAASADAAKIAAASTDASKLADATKVADKAPSTLRMPQVAPAPALPPVADLADASKVADKAPSTLRMPQVAPASAHPPVADLAAMQGEVADKGPRAPS